VAGAGRTEVLAHVGHARRCDVTGPRRSRQRPAPLLARGDVVGVVAPGFALRPGTLEAGLEALERMGYRPRVGSHVTGRDGYFAGTDDERLADLVEMMTDRDVRAIWFARGGYGTARLLDALRRRRLPREPKPLIGYSDLTALFSSVLHRKGQICLYGPVVAELGDKDAFDVRSLRSLLAGEDVTIRFSRARVVRAGTASGPLVGGNLTVLSHLLGTRYFPRLDGAVLALEDVGEETYRLDRMLQHLRMSGRLDRLAGVCIGSLDPPDPTRPDRRDRPLSDVVGEVFHPLRVPVVQGLPFGHVPRKRTLPLGGQAVLDTTAGHLAVSVREGR